MENKTKQNKNCHFNDLLDIVEDASERQADAGGATRSPPEVSARLKALLSLKEDIS